MASRRTKARVVSPANDNPPFAVSTGSSASSSDSESLHGARTSTEQAQIDREVLDDEEEQEKLLTGRKSHQEEAGFLRALGKTRSSRRRFEVIGDDKRELLYDTEEGGRGSSSPSRASSEVDREKIGYTQLRHGRAKRQVSLRCTDTRAARLIHSSHVVLSAVNILSSLPL